MVSWQVEENTIIIALLGVAGEARAQLVPAAQQRLRIGRAESQEIDVAGSRCGASNQVVISIAPLSAKRGRYVLMPRR
jgi:hypothetical protein